MGFWYETEREEVGEQERDRDRDREMVGGSVAGSTCDSSLACAPLPHPINSVDAHHPHFKEEEIVAQRVRWNLLGHSWGSPFLLTTLTLTLWVTVTLPATPHQAGNLLM